MGPQVSYNSSTGSGAQMKEKVTGRLYLIIYNVTVELQHLNIHILLPLNHVNNGE